MAEDSGRIDQYTKSEGAFNPDSKTYDQMFKNDFHKGNLHYAIVCVALLGCTLHTRNGETDISYRGKLFATERRKELVDIPPTEAFKDEAGPYHSLVLILCPFNWL